MTDMKTIGDEEGTTMTDNAKLREIRRKLDAIAPFPEGETVTASALARHFGVRAQERFTRGLSPAGPGLDGHQISAMCAEFAAAIALFALANAVPADDDWPDKAAAEIRDAIEDGGEIGPWLYEHLGEETAKAVAALAEELAGAQAAEAQDDPSEQMITVCDRCLRACCWKGVFMCDDSRDAGTRELSAGTLAIIDREHSDYWDGTYERGIAERDAAAHGEVPADA